MGLHASDSDSQRDHPCRSLPIWNPDGRPGAQEWLTLVRGLLGAADDDVNNAIG